MKKRRLNGATQKRLTNEEGVNPMDGMGNLADLMLVLACGLMIAIIAFWNVDLSKVNEIQQNEDYQSMGQAYEDPETGQIFIIQTGD